MTVSVTKLSLAGSVAAAITATCCVLPMALMLMGLGGAWIAVFGKVAAAGFYVGVLSTVLMGAAWFLAIRRGSGSSTIIALSAGSALIVVAWAVMLNETRINDYLISLM